MTGKIKMISPDRGFGFITSEDVDYFFHASDLDHPDDFHSLYDRDSVLFEEVTPVPTKGRRATAVRRQDRSMLRLSRWFRKS